MVTKLRQKDLQEFRQKRLAESPNCPLCSEAVSDPVCDHNHATGFIRGVICRSCNSLLGRIENGQRRFKVKNLGAFLSNSYNYLVQGDTIIEGYIYPTHKTKEEKAATAKRRRKLKQRKGVLNDKN